MEPILTDKLFKKTFFIFIFTKQEIADFGDAT